MTQEQVKTNPVFDAFLAGKNAGLNEDQIKMAMIHAGGTFKTVGKDYDQFMVSQGYMDSKKTKDEKIAAILAGKDVSDEAGFNAAMAEIIEQVKGMSERSISTSIRWYCRRNDLQCFVKPKIERTRITFLDRFAVALTENPHMTEAEAADIINGANGHRETSINIKKNGKHYQEIRRLVNSVVAGIIYDKFSTDETQEVEEDYQEDLDEAA